MRGILGLDLRTAQSVHVTMPFGIQWPDAIALLATLILTLVVERLVRPRI